MGAYEDADLSEICDLCGEDVFYCDCSEDDFSDEDECEDSENV